MDDQFATRERVADQIRVFYRDTIDPIRARAQFAMRPGDGSLRAPPMVLFVGNHSSGKSTFINHLLGSEVQESGMAPTHDDFTVLDHSLAPREIAGEALLSDEDLGFADLSAFGTSFARRIKMRSGPYEILRHLRLVDTPGMIDSADRHSGRDYDFDGVVAWFAERADLVVLFFDPERPGTTAETVSVFARRLASLDHKLVVVLNKIDQFRNVTDFARCYGTLCWNLAKVMRTKDLPQILPSYLQVPQAPRPAIDLSEFDAPRDRLLLRIKNAPSQRADNLISECSHYVEGLIAHCELLARLRERALERPRRALRIGVLASLGVLVVAGLLIRLGSEGGALAALKDGAKWTICAGVSLFLIVLWTRYARQRAFARFHARLDDEFEQVCDELERVARGKGLPPDRTRQTLERYREVTHRAAQAFSPKRLPKFRTLDRWALEHWLESKLPELRRLVHRNDAVAGTGNVVEPGATSSSG